MNFERVEISFKMQVYNIKSNVDDFQFWDFYLSNRDREHDFWGSTKWRRAKVKIDKRFVAGIKRERVRPPGSRAGTFPRAGFAGGFSKGALRIIGNGRRQRWIYSRHLLGKFEGFRDFSTLNFDDARFWQYISMKFRFFKSNKFF